MKKRLDGRFSPNDHTWQMRDHARRVGTARAARDAADATFGKGPLAGKTGNPFKDDKRFNPWAPVESSTEKHEKNPSQMRGIFVTKSARAS